MMLKEILKVLVVASSFLIFGQEAFALETKTGVISRVSVFGNGNYAFRIYFEGNPPMCSLSEPWAYVEFDDSNYDTKVASLLSAFSMGATVIIHTEASSRNHCNLIDVTGITR